MKYLRKLNDVKMLMNRRTQLTASAGIAANIMLSKVCSGITIFFYIKYHCKDLNKPNGQYFLARDECSIKDFLTTLPIRKVPGMISRLIIIKVSDVSWNAH